MRRGSYYGNRRYQLISNAGTEKVNFCCLYLGVLTRVRFGKRQSLRKQRTRYLSDEKRGRGKEKKRFRLHCTDVKDPPHHLEEVQEKPPGVAAGRSSTDARGGDRRGSKKFVGGSSARGRGREKDRIGGLPA